MKEIKVVGAAIIADGRVLAAQRGQEMTLSGLWEFPGGKLEAGETPQEALAREIMEELKTEIEVLDFVHEASYDYDFGRVIMKVYTARIIQGDPIKTEHSQLMWVEPDKLMDLDWAPVDIPIAEKLKKDLLVE